MLRTSRQLLSPGRSWPVLHSTGQMLSSSQQHSDSTKEASGKGGLGDVLAPMYLVTEAVSTKFCHHHSLGGDFSSGNNDEV